MGLVAKVATDPDPHFLPLSLPFRVVPLTFLVAYEWGLCMRLSYCNGSNPVGRIFVVGSCELLDH